MLYATLMPLPRVFCHALFSRCFTFDAARCFTLFISADCFRRSLHDDTISRAMLMRCRFITLTLHIT